MISCQACKQMIFAGYGNQRACGESHLLQCMLQSNPDLFAFVTIAPNPDTYWMVRWEQVVSSGHRRTMIAKFVKNKPNRYLRGAPNPYISQVSDSIYRSPSFSALMEVAREVYHILTQED